MRKFPSINYPKRVDSIKEGAEVVVQEKLDGANGRFTVTEDDEVLFGSRNVVFKENGEPQSIDRVNKQFGHAVKYVEQNLNIDAINNIDGDVTVYGECMHRHSVDYDAWNGKHPVVESDTPNFVVFDIFTDDGFVEPDKMRRLADEIGLEPVPRVDEFESLDFDEVEVPKSKFRDENPDAELDFNKKGLAEGVVIKNVETGERAKYVHPSFSEVKGSSNSNDNELKGSEDNHYFVEKYITKARVEKNAYKLIDKQLHDEIEMSMMRHLKDAVYEDAVDEASEEHLNRINDEEKVKKQSIHVTANNLREILQES